MKFGVVNKSTILNRFVLHTFQRNITRLAVITRKTNMKLGILKEGGGELEKSRGTQSFSQDKYLLHPLKPPRRSSETRFRTSERLFDLLSSFGTLASGLGELDQFQLQYATMRIFQMQNNPQLCKTSFALHKTSSWDMGKTNGLS